MDLVAKINLSETLSSLPLNAEVEVPFTMFKETSVRSLAVRIGKNYGRTFKVAAHDAGCRVKRTA